MVETTFRNYGADKIGKKIFLAGCCNNSGRTTVDIITEIDADHIEPGLVNSEGKLRFSVSEDRAIIKKLKVGSGENIDKNKLAEFEFSASILDDISNLYIETFSLNGDGNFLVFGYHRPQIDSETTFFEGKFIKPIGFGLRSWAMASGYLNYCFREGGELILLLDFSSFGVSYCFIKDNQPVQVGALFGNLSDSEKSKNNLNLLLADLTATIKYQTGILFKSGYSTPLSLIVTTGILSSMDINSLIEEKIKVPTVFPSIRKSVFNPDIIEKAGQYLVCLGLTVEI